MYLISEFSKITNLTVKTLHYYDREKLLIPCKRDSITGYRYYDQQNFQQAQQLSLLREFDFSIMEIKDILGTYQTEVDLANFLTKKAQQIQERIEHDQQLLTRLKASITSRKASPGLFQISDIVEEQTSSQLVISYPFKGHYRDVGKYVGSLYQAAGKYAKGAVFSVHYDNSYQDQASIRLCLPITQPIDSKNKQLELWEKPAQEVLSLRHFGSYDAFSDSYKRLFDYAKKQHYSLTFPSTEHYLKGPGRLIKGDPRLYETTINMPFKRK